MNDSAQIPPDEPIDPTQRDPIERVDMQIGPYRLLERLGEGAMGEVWRAEQREPIKRIVALKIIKRGMDTREVITRFEIERQAMALMDHPWIAKVHDAGETESGRPYIALEYIAGEKLTDYCKRNKLTIDSRLKLLQKICQAIQHAHQKAVIHRDLKPSNILVVEVDGEPVPKIIDFGIAKATAQRLTDRSAATFVGQLIGTPLYMSPEQVEMSAAGVDTRADVYSLGVILYELLSGALPHDPQKLANAALDQVLKVLREEKPDRPSTKISTLGDKTAEIAAQRGLGPRKLAGKLKGDLDWITLKALEKDRKRRYDTPRDLADDIERYLRLEAIEARPPSFSYRASRFARRHTAGVVAVTMVSLAIIAFAVWQTAQSRIIARERDRANANERLSLGREQLGTDPSAAVAYALSSLEILDQPGARDLIRKAISKGPLRDEWPRYFAPGNPITVDSSPDGRRCAVAWSQAGNPVVGVYDVQTLAMQLLVAPTQGVALVVNFTADGSHVILSGESGIYIWRVADGEYRGHFPGPDAPAFLLHRSSDPLKMWLTVNDIDEPTSLQEFDLLDGTIKDIGIAAGRHRANVQWHVPSIDPSGTWILDYDGLELFLQRVEDLDDGNFVTVGQHDAPISAVAIDRNIETAASVDMLGGVRVWDLRKDPPRLVGSHQQEPETYLVEFDPYGSRFFTSWGSNVLTLYECRNAPESRPITLIDRGHWTHDGTFLPDGSVVSCRNGIGVARWRAESAVAWSLDDSDSLDYRRAQVSSDGRSLYLWSANGQIVALSLIDGEDRDPQVLGRTPPLESGMISRFFVAPDGRRCVTYQWGKAPTSIDFDTGESQLIPNLDRRTSLRTLSTSGRMACFEAVFDDGDGLQIYIVDLDLMKVVASIDAGERKHRSVRFENDDAVVALSVDHIARFDLHRPSAPPDTLWSGDAQGGGFLFDEGRSAVVRDAEMILHWIDHVADREIVLGVTPQRPMLDAKFDSGRGILAIGGFWDSIFVFELRSGERWSLPTPAAAYAVTAGLEFDPLGRWLLSEHETTFIAWKFPLDPLFGELEYDEYLAKARSATNLRVEPSAAEPFGFGLTNTIDLQP